MSFSCTDTLGSLKFRNKIFYSRSESIFYEIETRYLFSHYDIDKSAPKDLRVHKNHNDTLLNISVDEDTKTFLLDVMPVKKGEVVLELGAYEGFGTLRLGDLVGEDGKVIAVEADRQNFKALCRNIIANNYVDIVFPIGGTIWGELDDKKFLKGFSNQANSLVSDVITNCKYIDNTVTVTVDSLIERFNLPEVDVVFMEINGAEAEALKGMKSILKQDKCRIVAAGWYEHGGEKVYSLITKHLVDLGFNVLVGNLGRVYAFKGYGYD